MNSKLIVVIIAIASLTGCTSMQTVNPAQLDLSTELESGDHLIVTEKSGRIIDMRLARVNNGRLVGSLTESPMEIVEVEIDQIVKMEVEKISGAKTTGAVLGTIVLAPIIAVGYGVAVAAGG